MALIWNIGRIDGLSSAPKPPKPPLSTSLEGRHLSPNVWSLTRNNDRILQPFSILILCTRSVPPRPRQMARLRSRWRLLLLIAILKLEVRNGGVGGLALRKEGSARPRRTQNVSRRKRASVEEVAGRMMFSRMRKRAMYSHRRASAQATRHSKLEGTSHRFAAHGC